MNKSKIEHLGTEEQPEYGSWTCASWDNWLHPLNGPSPNQVHILRCMGETFKVAVWDDRKHVITAAEMIDRVRNTKEIEASSQLGGWILDTRRWSVTPKGFENNGLVVTPPDDTEDDDEWSDQFAAKLAEGAVRLAVSTNAGGYLLR